VLWGLTGIRQRECQEGRENYKIRSFVTHRPLNNVEKSEIIQLVSADEKEIK
jgi:hypothetical protein